MDVLERGSETEARREAGLNDDAVSGAKSSMRYDAVLHLTGVKNSTKKNLMRVLYYDSCEQLVCANAVRLVCSSSYKDALDESVSEIVYVSIDQEKGHFLKRCQTSLQQVSEREFFILQERLLFSIRIDHISPILRLFDVFRDSKTQRLNLTHLRKLATRKSCLKKSEVFLRTPVDGDVEARLESHSLELGLCVKTPMFAHRRWSVKDVTLDGDARSELASCQYLVKTDIFSYVDFLKITSTILQLENGKNVDCDPRRRGDEDAVYESLSSLSTISENLERRRNKRRSAAKNSKDSKKRKIEENKRVLNEASDLGIVSSARNDCDERRVLDGDEHDVFLREFQDLFDRCIA